MSNLPPASFTPVTWTDMDHRECLHLMQKAHGCGVLKAMVALVMRSGSWLVHCLRPVQWWGNEWCVKTSAWDLSRQACEDLCNLIRARHRGRSHAQRRLRSEDSQAAPRSRVLGGLGSHQDLLWEVQRQTYVLWTYFTFRRVPKIAATSPGWLLATRRDCPNCKIWWVICWRWVIQRWPIMFMTANSWWFLAPTFLVGWVEKERTLEDLHQCWCIAYHLMYTKGRHPQAHSWPKVAKKPAAGAACCEGATDICIYMNTHTHIYICVCVCNMIYIYIWVYETPVSLWSNIFT